MRYRVITSAVGEFDENDFAEKVNEAISNGWEPLGGVALHVQVSSGAPLLLLAQAMTKDDAKDDSRQRLQEWRSSKH
jgi:hypothetical protein